ncbi:MAG: prolyl oligopeptidase family serine peptidase [Micromonosporaceae bacterium]|nr:prolyl oligopeptidase family serine peptidase [Micromonosporaceae bacterium]
MAGVGPPAGGTGAPVARVRVVRETHFGVPVADPYRWMEEPSGEFDIWLAGQARHARAVLDGPADRAPLLARVRALRGWAAGHSGFAVAGGRTFWLRHDPALAVPVLVVRDGTERVLLAPNQIAGPAHSHLDWFVPSPDGRYVAAAISTGGDERCTVRVVDVAGGGWLEDAVGNVRLPFLSWLDDCRSFVYHQFRDPPAGAAPEDRRLDSRTRRHRLGDDPDGDAVVLARGCNPRVPLSRTDRPLVYRPPGSEVVVAVVSHGALRGDRVDSELTSCTLYVAPAGGLADPASCPWVRVAAPADEVTAYALSRDTIYLVSHRDAPRGQVLAAPLADPARATVLVPQGERVVDSVRVAADWLLVQEHDCGVARLRRVARTGEPLEEVRLPVDGTILEWSDAGAGAALLRMESWTSAPRVYRYDTGAGTFTDTDWGMPTPAGFEDVSVHRIHAPARDGTPIPLTVIHRAVSGRDAGRPTLLTAYGSYGIPIRPTFVPGMLAWLERGGIWAVAHVRGGGELGRDWHRAGQLGTKQNTITDLIDCAEHLVAQRYTCPALLAGEGGSAGGIPTGGALVRRPDLWAAMVMHVPVADALRYEFSENGPINVPELGSVRTTAGLHALRIIDTYRRVQDGAAYPAVLLTTGRNDRRVATWQPAKLAARLQAATASGRPVLLRVEEHGGHGFGATTGQRDALLADQLAFLLDQLSPADGRV